VAALAAAVCAFMVLSRVLLSAWVKCGGELAV